MFIAVKYIGRPVEELFMTKFDEANLPGPSLDPTGPRNKHNPEWLNVYVVDGFALRWFIQNFGWDSSVDGDLHQAAVT